MKTLFIIAFICISGISFGQDATYNDLIRKAESYYHKNDFENALRFYSRAFAYLEGKGTQEDRYNAACCWAQMNQPDSAFFNLDKIVEKTKFSDYEKLIGDSQLSSLRTDLRWKNLCSRVKVYHDRLENEENQLLRDRIDSLAEADQKWRGMLRRFRNGELKGSNYKEDSIIRMSAKSDSLNYFEVREIFARYKYPGYDMVGFKASNHFWLLVQHQDLHPQFQDSVLAEMKIQVDSSNASGSDYAYLVDRVKVNTGQLQIYGTQMRMNADSTTFEPKPVVDPSQLNNRRKSMGLTSIEDYIESMNNFYHGTLEKKSSE